MGEEGVRVWGRCEGGVREVWGVGEVWGRCRVGCWGGVGVWGGVGKAVAMGYR